jgi:hypothetical protein
MSERALSQVVETNVKFAFSHGLEGCDALESAIAAVQHANVSLGRDYPRARQLARVCVDDKIARLDDRDVKSRAREAAKIARITGRGAIPETPAAQLLATCALPLDPAQRAELERRAAAER